MLSNLLRRLVHDRHRKAAADAERPTHLMQDAIAKLEAGDAESAIAVLNRALRRGGESVEVLTALGAAYRALDEPQRAIDCFLRALEAPGDATRVARLRNCGILFQELGQADEARAMFEEAVAHKPDDPDLLLDLALLCFDTTDCDGARSRVARALDLDPNNARAHVMRALDRLADGDYANGWPEYEWRFAAGNFEGRVPDERRRWTPEVRTGSVCATWEQGLGDQIMFGSCLPDLAAAYAGRCVVECDERLVGLFRRSFPALAVQGAAASRSRDPAIVPPTCDSEIPMGSLPGIFRRAPGEFPPHGGRYLRADPARVSYWRHRLREIGPGRAIGLSWRGGLPRSRRSMRSIEPEEFAGALAATNVVLVSLQYGDVDVDIARIAAATGRQLHHWPEVIRDYDETAALVSALDLVVSVCTSVVHLAGALGSKAWVLVPAVAEWRYGRRGQQMAWYESVRLFRQPAVGQWQPVIREIHELLTATASNEHPSS